MLEKITNYFTNLNNVGQALFVVGVLLVITFIILLIVVFKPEKKVKKIYGSNETIDNEEDLLNKLQDIDNISEEDINIENDKTRNLKSIVDELKHIESKPAPDMETIIQNYEDEQEDTAIISVEELLKAKEPFTYAKTEHFESINNEPVRSSSSEYMEINNKPVINTSEEHIYKPDSIRKLEDTSSIPIPKPKREVFSSVFTSDNNINKTDEDNKEFLNSLKDFRNNL